MKKKFIAASIAFFARSILSLTSLALSFAWFISISKVDPDRTAGAAGAYFAYGNGSPDSPFGINSPRHLYNLAWLQYRGKFNKDEDGDGKEDTYYFELASDIDRSGYTSLPPIGTKENPFIGNFQGNGHTIKNLTVSNNLNDFSRKPYSGVDSSDFPDNVNIVGFFGVVGSYNGSETYDTSANKILNTGLKGLTVKSGSSSALIGFLAGYVNGEIEGVAVDSGEFSFENNPGPIASLTENLSDYSLVGYVKDEKYLRQMEKSVMNSNAPSIDNPIAGQGQDNWGSSIDRKSRYTNLHAKFESAWYASYTTYEEEKRENESSPFVSIPASTQKGTDSGSHNSIYYSTSTDRGKDSNGNDVQTASYTFGADQTEKASYTYVGLSGKVDADWAKKEYVRRRITGYGNKDTFLLSYGNNYLSASRTSQYTSNPTVTLSNTTSFSLAVPLLYENQNLSFSRNGMAFYLNANSSSLTAIRSTLATTKTIWTWNDDLNLFSAIVGNQTRYLVYSNGSWTLSASTSSEITGTASIDGSCSYYRFSYPSSGTTYYLSLPSDKTNFVSTTADKTQAARFYIDTSNNNYIYALEGSTKYYLYVALSSDNKWWCVYVTTASSPSSNQYYFRYTNNGFYAATGSQTLKIYYQENQTYGDWSGNSDRTTNVTAIGVMNYSTAQITSSSDYEDSTDITETRNFLNDTYFPLTFDSDGINPSDKNTGYVIGGGNYTQTDNTSMGDIRLASGYKVRNGFNSRNDLQNSMVSGTSSAYSDSNFFAYTIKADSSSGDSGNLIKIGDPINGQQNASGYTSYTSLGFKKYYQTILGQSSGSRTAMGKLLSSDPTAYGLHFRNAEISENNLITVPYAKVNGQEYQNYQLPQDSIDFNLKTEGYINFFAATYFWVDEQSWQSKYNNSFFSLHTIERNGNRISQIKEISKIYDNREASYPAYVYEYTDGSYDTGVKDDSGNRIKGEKGTLLFDTRVLTNPDLNNEWVNLAAYYFEIPVNKGEFALGSVSGTNKNGAYLRYLDIGAGNKDDSNITIEEHSEIKVQIYSYPYGVDFTSITDLAVADEKRFESVLGGKSAAVPLTEGASSYTYDLVASSLNIEGPSNQDVSPSYVAQGRHRLYNSSEKDAVPNETHEVLIDTLTKYEIPSVSGFTSLSGRKQTTITVDGKTESDITEDVVLNCDESQAANILQFDNSEGEKLFTIEYSSSKEVTDAYSYSSSVSVSLHYDPITNYYDVTFQSNDGTEDITAIRTYFNTSLVLDNNTPFAGVHILNHSQTEAIALNTFYSFTAQKKTGN